MTRMFALAGAAVLLAGCEGIASPRVCDDDHIRYSVAAEDATAIFWAQALTGNGVFVLPGPVYVDSVNLSPYVTLSNRITFRCADGWLGQLVGKFTLDDSKPWELESHGCAWHKGSLRAAYLQASRFHGSIFHTFELTVDHSTDISFHQPYVYGSAIVLKDAGKVLLDGGYVGHSRFSYTGTSGPNGWGGPVTVMNAHVESTVLRVDSAQSANVVFNYFHGVESFVHARKAFVAHNDWVASRYNGEQAGCT